MFCSASAALPKVLESVEQEALMRGITLGEN
jgi:hypothetical protein